MKNRGGDVIVDDDGEGESRTGKCVGEKMIKERDILEPGGFAVVVVEGKIVVSDVKTLPVTVVVWADARPRKAGRRTRRVWGCIMRMFLLTKRIGVLPGGK